jgi:precorrin-6B methylase 2
MADVISWDPKLDPFLKERERAIHHELHRKQAAKIDYDKMLANPRLNLVARAEQRLGTKVAGTVFDIGAGSGYLSVWLAKNRDVSKVYALEASDSAAYQLIPAVVRHFGVEDKVQVVWGSFNKMDETAQPKFILAFGALHHSANLLKLLDECFRCLQPGGYLIAQEPMTEDTTSNSDFNAKYDTTENFRGIATLKNGERDDHFYRRCEYYTALHFAGFADVLIEDCSDEWVTPGASPSVLDRIKRRFVPQTTVPKPKGPLSTMKMLITAKKPLEPRAAPHRW